LRPSTGQSGTSAKQATASDPSRIAFARWLLGGAFVAIPVLPPWLWTSTEIELRSTRGRGRLRRPGRFSPATQHGVLAGGAMGFYGLN
jgi:hypothetical protein